jgi:phytoene synthase
MRYSDAIRSSEIRALANDADKDDENVGFLAERPLLEQAEWLTRFRWLRVADRLAENELLQPDLARFTAFRAEWRAFVDAGEVSGEHGATWLEMQSRRRLAPGDACSLNTSCVGAFDRYLAALRDYTRPALEIPTLAEHDRMLRRVTGNGVCVFPYLLESQHAAAVGFGMLDQMLNNLRDIAEDAAHGMCFLPRDVLARYGVTVRSLLDGSAIGTAAYGRMMTFWVETHLPYVREQAAAFLTANDLHPSLAAMRDASVARYARIERVFRACGGDFRWFQREYWGEVEKARVG